MSLQGKTAVITGASMGIGEAIATLLVREGAQVVLASRDLSRVEAARQRLGNLEKALAVACDVRDAQQRRALIQRSLERFGRIDLWVNNAGFGLVDSVEKMNMAECRRMFDTNLFAVIEAMQDVIPLMRGQGAGVIINVSSVAGHIAVPYMAAYGATKHALNCFTKAARLELRNTGVRIALVCPGYVNTGFSEHVVRGSENRGVASSIKMGIQPERVARAVLKAYLKNKREVIVPWQNRLVIALYRTAPSLFEWGMMKVMRAGKR
jgi:uncharacterized protein